MKLSWSIFCLLLLVCAVTLATGPTPWPEAWSGAWAKLSNGSDSSWSPLLDERLPRLIVLLCTGSSLAVSGAVMQALFQNPLASPSVLGVTSGGSLLSLIALTAGWHLHHPAGLAAAAVIGCLLTLLLVYGVARSHGSVQMEHLILTGIAISTTLVAIHGTILYALRDQWSLMQLITEWEAGSTHDRTWQHVHIQLPLTLIGLLGCWWYRQEVNILALGEDDASNLGVAVATVRWRLFIAVALLVGGALAAVGVIAFFGLILPHVVRRMRGPDHNEIIPLCTIVGAVLLATMDLLLRIFHVYALSIGNVSAVIGGLFFLGLLFGHLRETSKTT